MSLNMTFLALGLRQNYVQVQTQRI